MHLKDLKIGDRFSFIGKNVRYQVISIEKEIGLHNITYCELGAKDVLTRKKKRVDLRKSDWNLVQIVR